MATRNQSAMFAPLLRRICTPSIVRRAPFRASQCSRSAAPIFGQTHLSIRRFAHSIPQPPTQPPPGESDESPQQPKKSRVQSQPHYQLHFTCAPCGAKSSHNISKQGYHHGSVLVTCPGCRNRHVISDHLGIFGDRKITVEDLMREKGQLVKKGTLGEDGDIEFWEDDVPAQQEGFKLEGQEKPSS